MRKYIVIEGIHGSGKSTLAQALADKLTKLGHPAKYYHFPDENDDLGKVIRKVVADRQLVHQREITGLLYTAFANIFHSQTQDDDYLYILDRHSVTTGLVFQSGMSRQTRLEIYRPGIEALQTHGSVFYVKIDKAIAKQRTLERNAKMAQSDTSQVRKDKAKDQFIDQKFDELTKKYEENLLPLAKKLGLQCTTVDNNGSLEDTIEQMIAALAK